MKLFLTGFLQVFLVAINTYFIANKMPIGCAFMGFMISFVWSWNVKKVVFWHNERAFDLFGWSKHWECFWIIGFNVLVLENKNV